MSIILTEINQLNSKFKSITFFSKYVYYTVLKQRYRQSYRYNVNEDSTLPQITVSQSTIGPVMYAATSRRRLKMLIRNYSE